VMPFSKQRQHGWLAPYFDQSLFTHNVNYFIGLHIKGG